MVSYYGKDLDRAQLPFNFQLINAAWNAGVIAKFVEDYERLCPLVVRRTGYSAITISHALPRRVGSTQARIAAMLLLSLCGTPTMYYGDELGVGRVNVSQAALHDPWDKRDPDLGVSADPVRTPHQWDGTANAGFTAGHP